MGLGLGLGQGIGFGVSDRVRAKVRVRANPHLLSTHAAVVLVHVDVGVALGHPRGLAARGRLAPWLGLGVRWGWGKS